MTIQLTAISAAGATTVIVKELAAATVLSTYPVASLVAAVASIIEFAVAREFVTTSDVAPIAKFTRPAVLFIVCAPVVPGVTIVFSMETSPVKAGLALGALRSICVCIADVTPDT